MSRRRHMACGTHPVRARGRSVPRAAPPRSCARRRAPPAPSQPRARAPARHSRTRVLKSGHVSRLLATCPSTAAVRARRVGSACPAAPIAPLGRARRQVRAAHSLRALTVWTYAHGRRCPDSRADREANEVRLCLESARRPTRNGARNCAHFVFRFLSLRAKTAPFLRPWRGGRAMPWQDRSGAAGRARRARGVRASLASASRASSVSAASRAAAGLRAASRQAQCAQQAGW